MHWIGSTNTIQVTDSWRGGVVSDPPYDQNDLFSEKIKNQIKNYKINKHNYKLTT